MRSKVRMDWFFLVCVCEMGWVGGGGDEGRETTILDKWKKQKEIAKKFEAILSFRRG